MIKQNNDSYEWFVSILLIQKGYHFNDLMNYKSEAAVKEAGLIRQEGKDYIMKDGDMTLFKFNVTN